MSDPRDPSDIVQDLAVLYELSLAVGRTLDVEETCRTFLETLVARKSLDFASVWVRRALLPGGAELSTRDGDDLELVYANPRFRASTTMMSRLHPLVQRCEDELFCSAGFGDPGFEHFVAESGVERGAYMVFRLGDVGLLKLYSITRRVPFPAIEMGKLRHVVGKFAVAVEGSLEHHRLTDEQKRRRQLEQQVLHGQKLESLGLLAGGVAHDFNNLLTEILGNAELIRGYHPDVDVGVENILQASSRAAELCSQLLAFSGRGRFQVLPHNLDAVVDEMLRLTNATLSKKVRVERELHGKLPAVECDASQIRQVVLNLMTNANEAIGDEPGVLTVRSGVLALAEPDLEAFVAGDLEGPGDYVCIEVEDSGCGMDAATQARIFDPFFSTKFTGRGLGLAAVLGIVRGHRGGLAVMSQPGDGTLVRFVLPVTSSDSIPASGLVDDSGPLPGGTVLIADDEPGVRSVLEQVLQGFGFEVVVAVDGGEALARFEERTGGFDLVILDLTMPVMNGQEVFEEIALRSPSTCVILTSGFSENESVTRFQGARPAAFLSKPFRAADVQRIVRAVLLPE